jgi:hypothetical protein
MSLLDKGNETVTLYVEEVVTDSDGNTITRPSGDGVELVVNIQALPQSGTSARRAENAEEGFLTEQTYRLRFLRNAEVVPVGSQARIEWRDQYWAIFGDEDYYNGSRRTRHRLYHIRRS